VGGWDGCMLKLSPSPPNDDQPGEGVSGVILRMWHTARCTAHSSLLTAHSSRPPAHRHNLSDMHHGPCACSIASQTGTPHSLQSLLGTSFTFHHEPHTEPGLLLASTAHRSPPAPALPPIPRLGTSTAFPPKPIPLSVWTGTPPSSASDTNSSTETSTVTVSRLVPCVPPETASWTPKSVRVLRWQGLPPCPMSLRIRSFHI
jgi:hypothetical protein